MRQDKRNILPGKSAAWLAILAATVLMSLFLQRCANPVSPAGGPKDIAPPEMTGSSPEPGAVNFHGNALRLDFNEFVDLKNIQEELILSPPAGELPEIRLKGKSVFVEFTENLAENTTYSLFFGDAIADITESNIAKSFYFSFSTGPYIDSLSVEGTLNDAFTGEPVDGAFVMLYRLGNDTLPLDSLPYKVRPYYLTKSGKDGTFRINNVKNEKLKLFALKDANGNLIYDLPNESIAFSDSLVTPFYEETERIDTSMMETDSLEIIPDIVDTIREEEHRRGIELAMFTESDSIQQLLGATLVKPGEMLFTFKYPAVLPVVELMPGGIEENSVFRELNQKRDSLILWITDLDTDSIYCRVLDDTIVLDTVETSLKLKAGKRNEKQEVEIPDLRITSSAKGRSLSPFADLMLGFDYPVEEMVRENILLMTDTDTLIPDLEFTDDKMRRAVVRYKWTEESSCSLVLFDSALVSFGGIKNDSTAFSFNVRSSDDYGNFILNIVPADPVYDYVLQLTEGKDKVVREITLRDITEAVFNHLNPGQYNVRCIEDRNRNGRWDTGDYHDKLQPERVLFYPSAINILSNWDLVEVWEIPLP